MKTVCRVLFSASLILLAAACTVKPAASPSVTPLQTTLSPTSSPQPPTAAPTDTPSPQPSQIEISTETVAPTSTPDPRLTYRCLETLPTPPSDAGLEGVLVMENGYLLDLATGKKTSLGNVYDITVSLDGKKLAYLRLGSGQLVVADMHNKPLITVPATVIPLNPDWDHIHRWLDNDRLLIEKKRYIPFKESFKLDSLIVFNPTTREKQEFLPEIYPNIVVLPCPFAVGWSALTRVIPDPTLTRLVYPANGEEQRPTVLWDTQTGKEVSRIINLFGYGSTPIWLPDGSQFATSAPISFTTPLYGYHFENLPGEPSVGGEEIIGVSRDGKFKRLTYLTNSLIARPGEMSWSPDGRSIAYWVTIEGSQYPGERLAVADALTGQVTNYCIAGYPDPSHGQSASPVWSPDGKFLAVTVPDPKVRFQTNALVVDPLRGYAYKVADNVPYIGGWMSNSP